MLHRDVKPANVLLTAEPSPKLADFNISFSAKVTGATPAAYFGGSLAYMSPEQLEACNSAHPRSADDLDARSDLYSLGILLWELLTGERPFSEENLGRGWSTILERMAERRAQAVDLGALSKIKDCPSGLATVLEVALDPDRERRWSRRIGNLPPFGTLHGSQGVDPALSAQAQRAGAAPRFPSGRRAGAGRAAERRSERFQYALNVVQMTIGLTHEQHRLFERNQLTIVGVAYAIGAGIFTYRSVLVTRGLKRSQGREPITEKTRGRCLRLGLFVAIVVFALWLISAVADSIILRYLQLATSTPDLLRFFLWSLMCACLASAYPFFGITFFVLRSVYPAVLQRDLEAALHDEHLLKQLKRASSVALVAAVVAPLLSVGALIVDKLVAPDLIHTEAELAMGFFSAVCLAGLLPIFWLYQSIGSDLATFSTITAPHERGKSPRSSSRSGAHRLA